MVGCNRNLRVQDWIYAFLHGSESKTVAEIVIYLNHDRLDNRGFRPKGTGTTMTSQQVSGVVKGSRLFQMDEIINQRYRSETSGNSVVYTWKAIPIGKVVDDMINRPTRVRRYQPTVVKNEFKRRGLKIEEY